MTKQSTHSTQPALNRETWIRLLFILLFALLYGLVEIILAVVIIVQFGFVLITAKRNLKLLEFGASLSQYSYQILCFVTYNTEDKPFPFAPWPGVNSPSVEPAKAKPKEPTKENPREKEDE